MSYYDSVPATPDENTSSRDVSPPASPGSELSSEASTPLEGPGPESPGETSKRLPSLNAANDPRKMSDPTALGLLGKARHPIHQSSFAGSSVASLDNDVMARARAMQQQRLQKGLTPQSGSPSASAPESPGSGAIPNGFPGGLRLPTHLQRPGPISHPKSAPVIPKPSLSERRANKPGGMGMKLSTMGGGSPGLRRPGAPKLSSMSGDIPSSGPQSPGSKMDDFKKYIDTDKGWIKFDGAATITQTGVNFSNGQTFSISLDEIQVLGELGKGNYGTVYKVKHTRPKAPRFGHGLSGVKLKTALQHTYSDPGPSKDDISDADGSRSDGTTGMTMAMKEIRLELDDAKFTTILKELVILHECVSPYIIDFFGAFFQEGAVYICIEWMDGGSIDKLYAGGIPENVLRKITYATIQGLKSLKDDHNIIHRDVKPTNILVNTRGQVKICDFGVSGNLVASIAKTNIGCQSYMAPERISGGGMSQGGNAEGTYSVQSDIWSLGLTLIECALGRYPYPPEISSTIFSQLSAIVEGDPPDMPEEGYSSTSRDFVRGCLNKVPKARPTYAMLLKHPWLKALSKPDTITEESEESADAEEVANAVGNISLCQGIVDEEVAHWASATLKRKAAGMDGGGPSQPALHAAPLAGVSPIGSPSIGAKET